MIKHLVISGGGPTGLIAYGSLKTLSQNDFWKLSNIKSVYASSIGSFIATCVILGYSWKDLDDYLLKRPWEKAFNDIKTDILEIIYNKGIDGEKIFDICMSPLLKGKDLEEDITLKQFYEFNNVDLYLTATELNKDAAFKVEVLSHKTHPHMPLIKALACSAAFPFMFKPICYEDKAYLDGGILCNFPLNLCLQEDDVKSDEILALQNVYDTLEYTPITSGIGFLDYSRTLMKKTHKSLDLSSEETYDIVNIVPFEVGDCVDFNLWFQCISDKELRATLVNRGECKTKEWLSANASGSANASS